MLPKIKHIVRRCFFVVVVVGLFFIECFAWKGLSGGSLGSACVCACALSFSVAGLCAVLTEWGQAAVLSSLPMLSQLSHEPAELPSLSSPYRQTMS